MTMLMDIGQLARTSKIVGVPDTISKNGYKTQMTQDIFPQVEADHNPQPLSKFAANDIILTLSQGNPSRMYTLQPDAIKVLLRQFENPVMSNSAWKEAVSFTKKVHISLVFRFFFSWLLSDGWLRKLTEAKWNPCV